MRGKDNLLQGNLNFLKKNAVGLGKEVRPLFSAETAKSKAYRKQERQALSGGFNSDVFPLYLHGFLQRNELQVKTQAIVNA